MNNIREIGIPIKRYKTTLVEEIAIKEEIVYVNRNVVDSRITVGTRFYNSSEEVIKEDELIISEDNYELVMSDSDFFEDGKELNVIRDSDLWQVIDKIREK